MGWAYTMGNTIGCRPLFPAFFVGCCTAIVFPGCCVAVLEAAIVFVRGGKKERSKKTAVVLLTPLFCPDLNKPDLDSEQNGRLGGAVGVARI